MVGFVSVAAGSLGRNTNLNLNGGSDQVRVRTSQDWPVPLNRLSIDR